MTTNIDSDEYIEESVYVILDLGTDITAESLEKLSQGDGLSLTVIYKCIHPIKRKNS